ncbi:MAG: ABC transporter permease [Chloroflexota bacterium]|nr:ABC transporter permease [Chloroflexota bacterium]
MATNVGAIDQRRGRNERSPLVKWAYNNRRALSSAGFLMVMVMFFTIPNPEVFLQGRIYTSVMVSLPLLMFLAVPLVFVVTAGEIDLSFPAVAGLSSLAFASTVQAGLSPWLGLALAIGFGMVLGTINGIMVVYGNLSSLVATLGVNFLLRGLINMIVQGKSIAMPELRGEPIQQIMAGRVGEIPSQMFIAIGFVLIGWVIFNFHRFGSHVQCVGDNPESATEMGINVRRTRVSVFVFVGIGAALAGVTSTLINTVWWPSTGDGLLLPVLASVFVGGTPSWGGVGTVVGSAIGAAIVSFIETGVIANGLTGYFTQFFNGLIIILSLIGHRFAGKRHR